MPQTSWLPEIGEKDRPAYLAIAEAIARDITCGRLRPGQMLPPQRAIALAMSLDFTTVNRAFAEARRRGLIEGVIGRGTFVKAGKLIAEDSRPTDFTMSGPPKIASDELVEQLWTGIQALKGDGLLDLLLRYRSAGGNPSHRQAGCAWLQRRLPEIVSEQIFVCAGIQAALTAVLGMLTKPGDTILAEALTYPGILSIASHLRLKVIPVEMDRDGLLPESFDAMCKAHHPKALYCNPTIHNPTASTLGVGRRQALAVLAIKHGVEIIEDDAQGHLPNSPPPPIATFAPQLVYYISGLAKCVSPALKVAYLVIPDVRKQAQMEGTLKSLAGGASPITAEIASQWIFSGTAEAVLNEIRNEMHARFQILRKVFPASRVTADAYGIHAWLQLPDSWTNGVFCDRSRAFGLGIVGSDAFSLGRQPEGVRLALGSAADRVSLEQSLLSIFEILELDPRGSSSII